MAHRMTRAFAAIGLIGAGLADTLVLSGWTPWGPLPQPNAFFTYDEEAERTKEWAINCHASQVKLTDYTEFCEHLGRAYAALTREWSEGHRLAGGRPPRADEHPGGVELFRIESFDPARADLLAGDPIQIALGILRGTSTPPPSPDRWPPSRPVPRPEPVRPGPQIAGRTDGGAAPSVVHRPAPPAPIPSRERCRVPDRPGATIMRPEFPRRLLALVTLLPLIGPPAVAQGADTPVDVPDLPAQVRQAIEYRLPGGRLEQGVKNDG